MKTDLRKKELIRGKILYYLSLVYPHPTALSMLQGELDIFGYPVPMEEMEYHVAYLAGKGFVQVEKSRGPRGGHEITMVTITVKGIDYHDGRLPADDGVYLEPQS